MGRILPRPFRQHDRRKRPKRLPGLTRLFRNILHFRFARIRKQAAIAERPRSELGTALEPADHALVGEQLCRLAAAILAAFRRGLNANQKFRGGAVDILIV